MKLHPALAGWFDARFRSQTEIQHRALRHTLTGKNTLILAPTGSGKTLAAFLSVLSKLAYASERAQLPNAVCAVYVSPLRALGRDIHRNLESPLQAINETLPEARRIRMEVRTGDTAVSDRGKQQRRRPHLLLTTPESLSSILSQSQWREGGFAPLAVIVDEIHAFAESKRGSLLALALERLEARATPPMQRIGLSATARPISAITQFLCGNRDCAVAQVDLRRAHKLEVAELPADLWLPPAGYNPFRIAAPVANLVEEAHCTLVFTATRSAAERLSLALKILLPQWDEVIAVHHGSVDRATREEVEAKLSEGTLKAVVCSSSLELGIDFSSVDRVLLIGAPRGVSRAIQRLGRSGHRVGGVASGWLVPLNLPDLLECIALRHAAQKGRLDAIRPPKAPLDVLAQALLGMSIERVFPLDEAFELVRRAGPYRDLGRADFDSVVEYLAGGGKVLGPYGTYGKIVVREGSFLVASQTVARAYYMNTGVISDDVQMKVVTRTNRRLGEVEENFLASLQPGEAFLIGGKTVALKTMFQNTAVVVPAGGERVRTPRWMGGKMPLTAQLAAEERDLRRSLREAWNRGGVSACSRILQRTWHIPREPAQRAARFIERQYKAAPIPVDEPVQVEQLVNRRTLILLFHVVQGRAVNRSLAWVLGARLANSGSMVANFDDHGFLLSMDIKLRPDMNRLREGFNPDGWTQELNRAIASTETLGRQFRHVAEIGQLLPKRTARGNVSARSSTWSAALLYSTLREHESEHPLVREAVREVLEDQCDAENALSEAERIYRAPWEIFDLPRPSPFGLPLFASSSRVTLMAQDPDQALDDLVSRLYEDWADNGS